MTEEMLRLILRNSTKEELENKLVDLFDVIEDYAQQIDRLQKENEQLKALIEKMKCCSNCRNLSRCTRERESIVEKKQIVLIKFPCCWELEE